MRLSRGGRGWWKCYPRQHLTRSKTGALLVQASCWPQCGRPPAPGSTNSLAFLGAQEFPIQGDPEGGWVHGWGNYILFLRREKYRTRDFPGGRVVKNQPSNARDAGLIPGLATKIPRAAGHLSLRTQREILHVAKKKKKMIFFFFFKFIQALSCCQGNFY